MTESQQAGRDRGVEGFAFDGLVVSGPSPAGTITSRRYPLLAGSVLLHLLVVAGILVVPLLRESVLPEPGQGFDAIFVTPTLAPPPPPPPPPGPTAPVRQVSVATQPHDSAGRLTAPIDIPDTVEALHDLDFGIEGGVAGGVAGGVEGGVLGGIVGGILEEAAAVQPMRVGGEIKEPAKLVNVAPVYPEEARRAHVEGVVILECTVTPQGKVSEVRVLRGIPMLTSAAIGAVKQWCYTPTLYGGVPIPVTMTVTVRFNLG